MEKGTDEAKKMNFEKRVGERVTEKIRPAKAGRGLNEKAQPEGIP